MVTYFLMELIHTNFFLFIVHSFTELANYLLNLEGAEFVLSETFCQDNLEIFFGQQRLRGRRNDNPTVDQFIYNSQSIITNKSINYGHCSNIERKRSRQTNTEDLNSPMAKRKSKCRRLNFES